LFPDAHRSLGKIERFMSDKLLESAMTTWATKDLPARLFAGQVAKLLNCTTDDVTILVSAGKLRPLGRPNLNGVKFFHAIQLFTLLADPEWLDDATKTIGQFWRRKNARRNGLTPERQVDDKPAVRPRTSVEEVEAVRNN
jgi:hypothetical protein